MAPGARAVGDSPGSPLRGETSGAPEKARRMEILRAFLFAPHTCRAARSLDSRIGCGQASLSAAVHAVH